ncbi:hypothetical protein CB0940_05150 [Cercospora beticola]|uniref:Uncharacterized protein n=1 Tax=Cercospora beticola TaxID=122368 RepID=A0A2G5HMC3_CERBT|nr:hypothetical protein CB0940_05150 [Cercospora beticola]PIA93694.1 hypothetical protein CB0940_05150 [Cercospora beticola]WPB02461.1 hypothetical protein RHO25_007097 [Cercospora beticola]CAK1362647.1 unnamed protein product [Cercospora beticola]
MTTQDKTQELLQLLSKAQDLAQDLASSNALDPKTQAHLTQLSKTLHQTLQPPVARIADTIQSPYQLGVLATALSAGWLEHLHTAGPSGLTINDLASKSSTSPSLTLRLIRYLSASNLLTQLSSSPETFSTTPTTSLLTTTPGLSSGIKHAIHCYALPVSKMPEFFQKHGYNEPSGPENCLYSYAYGRSHWEATTKQPEIAKWFNEFMAMATFSMKSWVDVFDVGKLKVQIKNEDADGNKDKENGEGIMLIDVGGGRGHELEKLAKRKNELGMKGKLILQDRKEVLEQVPSEWKGLFEKEVHDFFKPQEEKFWGARTYYMRKIMHDWTDLHCSTILSHLRDAMKPGYSTLLINDIVVPERDCQLRTASLDLIMLTVCAGKQRTEKEWHELVEGVKGLQIVKIWPLEESGESVIEVVRGD